MLKTFYPTGSTSLVAKDGLLEDALLADAETAHRLVERIGELERHAELALIACNAGDLESAKQAISDALAG